MPAGVIDVLEVVDVDHDDRQPVTEARRAIGLFPQPVEEQAPVVEPRQLVGVGFVFGDLVLAAQFFLELLHAQRDAHSRHDHLGVERLEDVIIRPAIEGLDDVVVRVEAGEENDRDVPRRLVALQRLADLAARHQRHPDVEKDAIRQMVLGLLDRLDSIGGYEHIVALTPDHGLEKLQIIRLVVCKQDEGLLSGYH